jgi:tRNA(fMet)-specific endonuclease VapC
MTLYLFDSDTCIEILRNRNQHLIQKFRSTAPTDILLSSVVMAELYYGVFKSPAPRQAANLSLLVSLTSQFTILPFDAPEAEECGRIRAELERQGIPIGAYDLQIAATALVQSLTLVTHNTKHFSRVPGLATADWHGP